MIFLPKLGFQGDLHVHLTNVCLPYELFGILALSRITPYNLRLAYIYVSDKPRPSKPKV